MLHVCVKCTEMDREKGGGEGGAYGVVNMVIVFVNVEIWMFNLTLYNWYCCFHFDQTPVLSLLVLS